MKIKEFVCLECKAEFFHKKSLKEHKQRHLFHEKGSGYASLSMTKEFLKNNNIEVIL